jgi:hypothetical protein
MYALGTRIAKNGVDTIPYSSNEKVPERLLRTMAICFGRCVEKYFPQLAVLRDLESDAGMLPSPPMEDSTSHNCRAGYTIDMSINLGSASHYNVHDKSQGYSEWTGDVLPGCGKNWYCILPNVYGRLPPVQRGEGYRVDGPKYHGLANKLTHGVAISWDGCVIRHCTSVSKPDGMDGERDGNSRRQSFGCYLYGTFTAAKERVVQAGRAWSAARLAEQVAAMKAEMRASRKQASGVAGSATADVDANANGDAAANASDVSSFTDVAAVADAAADADVCAGTSAHDASTPASPEAPITPEWFLPVTMCMGSFDYYMQKIEGNADWNKSYIISIYITINIYASSLEASSSLVLGEQSTPLPNCRPVKVEALLLTLIQLMSDRYDTSVSWSPMPLAIPPFFETRTKTHYQQLCLPCHGYQESEWLLH